jgi:hypothetical protein
MPGHSSVPEQNRKAVQNGFLEHSFAFAETDLRALLDAAETIIVLVSRSAFVSTNLP